MHSHTDSKINHMLRACRCTDRVAHATTVHPGIAGIALEPEAFVAGVVAHAAADALHPFALFDLAARGKRLAL